MDQIKNTHFDLSDSVLDELKDNEHKKVIGKSKDETNSLPISECVALNPNCYYFNHLTKYEVIQNTESICSTLH